MDSESIVQKPAVTQDPATTQRAADDFYRPGAAPKEVRSYSTEELEHRLTVTAAISANLKAIRDDTTDWEALEHRLEGVIAAMRLVREFSESLDLERLEVRLASIASALRLIAEDGIVKELEAKQ